MPLKRGTIQIQRGINVLMQSSQANQMHEMAYTEVPVTAEKFTCWRGLYRISPSYFLTRMNHQKKSPLTRNSVCHCFVEMHIYYQITVIILLCFRQNRLMFILGSGLSYRIDPVDIGWLILTLRKINEPAVCPSTCILLTIDKWWVI